MNNDKKIKIKYIFSWEIHLKPVNLSVVSQQIFNKHLHVPDAGLHILEYSNEVIVLMKLMEGQGDIKEMTSCIQD